VAVSPDGKILAGGYAGGHLASLIGNTYLWNVSTGRQVGELPGPNGPAGAVQAVAFSPDGRKLAVGYGSVPGSSRVSGNSGTTCIWTIAFGKCGRTLAEAGPMGFSPGGRLLAIGSGSSTYVWNMLTGRLVRTVPGGVAVAFNGDGLVLATGDKTGTVKLWNTITWAVEAQAVLPTKAAIRVLALSPNGAYAAAYQDGSTYIWPARVSFAAGSGGSAPWRQVDAPPSNDQNGAVAVIFSPNSKELLTGESDGTLTVRAVPGLRRVAVLSVPGLEPNAVALSPNGETLAASPNSGPVYVWPAKTSHV
jgi:WD40 repeat protein